MEAGKIESKPVVAERGGKPEKTHDENSEDNCFYKNMLDKLIILYPQENLQEFYKNLERVFLAYFSKSSWLQPFRQLAATLILASPS